VPAQQQNENNHFEGIAKQVVGSRNKSFHRLEANEIHKTVHSVFISQCMTNAKVKPKAAVKISPALAYTKKI